MEGVATVSLSTYNADKKALESIAKVSLEFDSEVSVLSLFFLKLVHS